MRFSNRWQDRNPLVRRVRRHSTVTTLFRATDPAAAALAAPAWRLGVAPTVAPQPDAASVTLEPVPAFLPVDSASPTVFPADQPLSAPAATTFAPMADAQPLQRASAEQTHRPSPANPVMPQPVVPPESTAPASVADAVSVRPPLAPALISTAAPFAVQRTAQAEPPAATPRPGQTVAPAPRVMGQIAGATPAARVGAPPISVAAVTAPPPPAPIQRTSAPVADRQTHALGGQVSPTPASPAVMGVPDSLPAASVALAGPIAPPPIPAVGPAAVGVTTQTASVAAAPTPLPTTPSGVAPTVQRQAADAGAAAGSAPVTPPRPRPPAAPATTGSMDDRTWTRLQAIYRKHQERNAAATAAEESQDAALQRQTMRGALPTPAIEQTPLPHESASSAPPTSAPVTTDQTPAVSATAPPSLRERVEAGPPTVQPAPALLSPAPLAASVQRTAVVDTGERQPLLSTALSTNPGMASAGTADEQITHAAGDMTTLDAMASVTPPLSAQTGWTVQRLEAAPSLPETPTPTAASPALMQQADALAVSAIERQQKAMADQTMRQRLATIQPDQPTESRIDVILPRRPRPQLRPRADATSTANATSPLQRQPEPTTAATPPAPVAAQTIETEIGPLPVELWQAIGAPPPAPAQPPAQPVAPIAESAPMAAGLQDTAAITAAPPAIASLRPVAADGVSSLAPPVHKNEATPLASAQNVAAIQRTAGPAAPPPTVQSSGQPMTQPAGQPDAHAIVPPAVVTPIATAPSAPVQRVLAAADLLPAAAAEVDDDPAETIVEEAPSTAAFEAALQAAGMVVQSTASAPVSAPTAAAPTTTKRRKRAPAKAAAPVQRQTEAVAPPPAPPSATMTETETNAPPTPAQAEIDTDELARQVYSQIKRKLAVERERLR